MRAIERRGAPAGAAWGICLALLLGLTGCESDTVRPSVPDGGWQAREAGFVLDGMPDLGVVPDGLPSDKQGPKVEILAPVADVVVVADVLRVRAKITDDDGVDPSSVKVTLQSEGQTTVVMAPGNEPETFEAQIDLGALSGNLRVWVVAADLLGHANSAVRDFRRDAGPTVSFLTPAEAGRHKGSLKVEVLVTDNGVTVKRFDLALGGNALKTSSKKVGADGTRHTATVAFDDPYDPPLEGEQVLTATAENENGAVTVVKRTFFIDVVGPTITVVTPAVGQVVGGVMKLAAQVTDLAGVLPSSVRCVVGNEFDSRLVKLVPSTTTPDLFEGELDTRELDQTDLWPVVSFRAADGLGNERHQDFEVGLDNGPPVAELDPPTQYFVGKYKGAKVLQCSHPFDPVGADAADDAELVPQVVALRARVEDQGNPTISAKFVPVALVDRQQTFLYVLDDTKKALLVDSTGDGFCDRVNPELVPKGSQPQLGEAVAVQMAPVPPAGSADFTPWSDPFAGKSFPFTGCVDGDAPEPPDPLCLVSELSRAVFANGIPDEPALWVIPPVVPGSQVQCLGLPFDFGANEIANGWVCAAIEAVDQVGNRGVSKPLRLWLNKSATLAQKGSSPPGSAGSPPDCTGTLDAATGKVDAFKPCKIRDPKKVYPQVFGDPSLLIEPK